MEQESVASAELLSLERNPKETLVTGNKTTAVVEFSVTQSDIDNGVPLLPRLCMVAKSCTRTLGKPVRCLVNYITFLNDQGERMVLTLPEEVVENIQAFDRNKPVFPFEFTLDMSKARQET